MEIVITEEQFDDATQQVLKETVEDEKLDDTLTKLMASAMGLSFATAIKKKVISNRR